MTVCMNMHEHTGTCDSQVAEVGRLTTVLHVRVSDSMARRLRVKLANSRKGYGSVSELIEYILETQVLRDR